MTRRTIIDRCVLGAVILAVIGFIIVGVPLFVLHWDCDDIALANYRIGTFLHQRVEIDYQLHDESSGHVWTAIDGISIMGGSRIDGHMTLGELKQAVEDDK